MALAACYSNYDDATAVKQERNSTSNTQLLLDTERETPIRELIHVDVVKNPVTRLAKFSAVW